MSTPQIILIALSALVFISIIFLLILYWIYAYAFRRSKTDCSPYAELDSKVMAPYSAANRERIDRLLSTACEDVYISSPLDGIRLHARLYRGEAGKPLQILCHGYRSTPFRDFSGGALEAMRRGHSVLMIDQRAMLESDGKEITFGIRERHDLLGWTRYATEEFPGTDIVLIGISMGGATVVAASSLELPEAVRCIISDCPYAKVKDVLISTARKMHFPACVYPLIKLAAKLYGRIDLDEGDLNVHAKGARVPILIIHGEADRLVPCDMSAELAAANPDMITRATFEGAHHGISYLTNPERYVELAYGFIERHTELGTNNRRTVP